MAKNKSAAAPKDKGNGGYQADSIQVLKGLEAVRDSLLDSTPQLKNVDLRKFVDDRFVKAK